MQMWTIQHGDSVLYISYNRLSQLPEMSTEVSLRPVSRSRGWSGGSIKSLAEDLPRRRRRALVRMICASREDVDLTICASCFLSEEWDGIKGWVNECNF